MNETIEEFEKDVEWLRKNIPPDDIYVFAEQMHRSAINFLRLWAQYISINEECAKDNFIKDEIDNLLTIHQARESGEEGFIQFNPKRSDY